MKDFIMSNGETYRLAVRHLSEAIERKGFKYQIKQSSRIGFQSDLDAGFQVFIPQPVRKREKASQAGCQGVAGDIKAGKTRSGLAQATAEQSAGQGYHRADVGSGVAR